MIRESTEERKRVDVIREQHKKFKLDQKEQLLFYIQISMFFFKEFLLNTTEKFSLLAQAFTNIYTLHLQGEEFRKRQKIHAVNSYTGYRN